MTAGPWRQRAYRWRWWLAALGLLLAVRAALPEVLRRVIASQASEALRAKVDVGDVDLRLWRGGVALEDVAVRPLGAPDRPPPPPDADPNAVPPAFDEYSPILGFKRFAVEVRFLPLFSKIVQVRGIEIDTPRVALDRLASGDLNVMALVPQQPVGVEAGATPQAESTPIAAAGTPPGEAPAASAWAIGLDQFTLLDGRIRFRDLALQGSEPLELGIDRITVEEIALTPVVYGKPGHLKLKLGIDEGVVDVDARLTLNDGAVSATAQITANRLPLRRARLYVPNVGWSDLRGELDLGLTHELEPEKTNALSGTVALRAVSVAVPGLEDVAVKWDSLAVDLERIDLMDQRAAVRSVALAGASVTIRLQGGELLPVLAKPGQAAAQGAPALPSPAAEVPSPASLAGEGQGEGSSSSSPTATPSPTAGSEMEPSPQPSPASDAGEGVPPGDAGEGAPADPAGEKGATPAPGAPPAKPWHWQLGELTIATSTIRVLSEHPPLDVGVALKATALSGEPDAIGHIALDVSTPPGTLALAGDVRIAGTPAFGGTLKIADLALPPLVAVSGAAPAELLPSAILRSDLAIAAGLAAPGGGEASADRLRVSGTLGIAALRVAPPESDGLTVELQDLDLRLDQLAVPGVIPPGQKAAAGDAIALGLGLTLREVKIARAGAQPLAVAVQQLELTIPQLTVPAMLAALAPADGVPIVTGGLGLALTAPRVALGADDLTVAASRIALTATDVALPVAPPAAPPPASAAAPAAVDAAAPAAVDAAAPAALPIVGAPPARLALQVDLADLQLAAMQGKELNVTVPAAALTLKDVVVPGFVAGAPPAPGLEPLQAAALLTLTQPRVARGDGKDFAVSAKSISIPLTALAMPGVPGGLPPGAAPPPLRATLGEIRFEAPAIRVTRTKDGIILPAAGSPAAGSPAAGPPPPAGAPSAAPAPAPSPTAAAAPGTAPATQPLELQIAALRVLRGGVEFVDRAVQPTCSTRFAPIEIEARNVKLPGPFVKPLKVDITSVEQGQITVRGELSPDASTLELKVDQLALAPFNPYATTYSSYSIADGALSITTKATAQGGKFDVKNDITLHQFDLAGAEGDSLFEQQFGLSLSMALALLRDLDGNIDIGVPLGVDREGNAQIDVMAVVRSALAQAITGAVTSPLKMLGAVAGGKGAPIAPAPIAFRLGRALPTGPGSEAADRLAAFLASRPAMGVQLTTAATADDARWLHEQGLLASWEDEGFFARSVGFVVAGGPRQRLRAYLEGRAADEKPELSVEDAATLDQWLAERPAPSAAELQALTDARLGAVEAALTGKDIAATRIARGAPPEEPPGGAPTVTLRLQAAGRATAAPPAPQP